ncbi:MULTISPECIES: alpha/beta hydrolase family protein [Variovorax]|jgi:predicted dienelactone hydrolase|uniref:alpha/beta hydrolase family protein n=1 Tax=Variovorax TaxID=34072 RepID=UPI00086F271F|nr:MULTISPECIES: alpha/beta fold hydrolase [Variovorax]MBN8757933.1 alpha/beta fold hydrolase [Variovorax sp.]ODU13370.1 MAG: dienelactone hydrolase [Variovorax sp. SCN 67-85]ODV23035.1 MAG: dienelactone hydrolase [Variovorax sp. SCN 67-20]OJZ12951.1 MAG: dienelactone hydrolase [Variovorax sp. 67-131]UKI09538.1 alpha/beta fold hydrolase [Variovorax paradoxus]
MRTAFRQTLLLASGLLLSFQIMAADAGWRQLNIPGATPDAPPTVVALYYPTQAPARSIPMGPFTVRAAIQAPPDDKFKGLIVLSHGIGGTELGHTSIAEALARGGYLVAALRHPGDNWQEHSLMQQGAKAYFTERPRQISRVIDALLQDPQWKDRIARDAEGFRVGAVGHSAGGYTVLAVAGAQADLSRIGRHCESEGAADPIFCNAGRNARSTGSTAAAPASAPAASLLPSLRDPRVRAVVAMAPAGQPFTAASLAAIRVPTRIYEAQQDRFLVPRFHAEWVAQNMPTAELERIPNAWHFAFMDTPATSIPSDDGDIRDDPPGFDRKALLVRLGQEIPAFFDKALAAPGP